MLTRSLRALRERVHPLQRIRRLPFFARVVQPLLDVSVSRRVAGVAWPVRMRLLRHATYVVDSRIVEPGELALFAALCRRHRPPVFWDVGANVGLYSWLALSADPAARAVLFEPDPDNLALLARTIRDAALTRATVVAAAVGDRAGTAGFRVDPLTGHTGSLASGAAESARSTGPASATIMVRTVTLDAMLATHPAPALVKIDVEGAEEAVLAGGATLLAAHRPIVLIESFAPARAAVIARLVAAGYVVANAEDPDGGADKAANLLALPARCAGDLGELRVAWRAELAARGLGRRRNGVDPLRG